MKAALVLTAVVLCWGCLASATVDADSHGAAGTEAGKTSSPAAAVSSAKSAILGAIGSAGAAKGGQGEGERHGDGLGQNGTGTNSVPEGYGDNRYYDHPPRHDRGRHGSHYDEMEVCIPEFVAVSLLSKIGGTALGSPMPIWPYHRLSRHKLQDMLYYSALAKPWQNQ